MKYGVIPPYGVGAVESGEFAASFAAMAEEVGFESVWVVEHVVMAAEYRSVYPYAPSGRSPFSAQVSQPDPLLWLSYVAAATRRLRLATGILNVPQRNPLILAKEVASLDCLSGGRVELGIGVGWVREEAEALGVSFDDRGRRTDEYLEAMRTLWREPVASFHGDFARFEGVVCEPRPLQEGGVPIIVGGHSKAAARRAGRLGNGLFPLGVSPEKLASLRELMHETARECGRDPDALPITCAGRPERESAELYAGMGVERMVVATRQGELSELRRWMEGFAESVMRKA